MQMALMKQRRISPSLRISNEYNHELKTSNEAVSFLARTIKYETINTAGCRLALSKISNASRTSFSSFFRQSSLRLRSSSTSWRCFVTTCSSRSLLCARASASTRAQVILWTALRRISTSVISVASGLRAMPGAMRAIRQIQRHCSNFSSPEDRNLLTSQHLLTTQMLREDDRIPAHKHHEENAEWRASVVSLVLSTTNQ